MKQLTNAAKLKDKIESKVFENETTDFRRGASMLDHWRIDKAMSIGQEQIQICRSLFTNNSAKPTIVFERYKSRG